MALYPVHNPVADQIPTSNQGDAAPVRFEDEELDILALELWRQGSCFKTFGDECCLCKGEAQRCLAMCL
jgi:hypothetical protein